MRKGFTLIEMLVVIAVIGILAALMAPSGNSAFSAAKEATCRNNLKNLQNAVINFATDNGNTYLPRAGSFEAPSPSDGRYYEYRGWISWIRKGSIKGYPSGKEEPQVGNMEDGWNVANPDAFNPKRAYFAITNGTLWEYTSHELGVYVCPVAAKSKEVGFHNFGQTKGFSTYVMNEYFFFEGYKRSETTWGQDPRSLSAIGTSKESIAKKMGGDTTFTGFSPEGANLLLFAEHSGTNWDDRAISIGRNCVLHVPPGGPDSKSAASIGAYHGRRKSEMRGLCIFLDGHVDALKPKVDVGTIRNQAYWICRGESAPKN